MPEGCYKVSALGSLMCGCFPHRPPSILLCCMVTVTWLYCTFSHTVLCCAVLCCTTLGHAAPYGPDGCQLLHPMCCGLPCFARADVPPALPPLHPPRDRQMCCFGGPDALLLGFSGSLPASPLFWQVNASCMAHVPCIGKCQAPVHRHFRRPNAYAVCSGPHAPVIYHSCLQPGHSHAGKGKMARRFWFMAVADLVSGCKRHCVLVCPAFMRRKSAEDTYTSGGSAPLSPCTACTAWFRSISPPRGPGWSVDKPPPSKRELP